MGGTPFMHAKQGRIINLNDDRFIENLHIVYQREKLLN